MNNKISLLIFSVRKWLPTACVYGGCAFEARPCPRGRNEVKKRARQSQRSPAAAINTLLPPVRSPFVKSLLFQFGFFVKHTFFLSVMLFYCQKICLSAIFLNILSHRKKISRFARLIFLSHWGPELSRVSRVTELNLFWRTVSAARYLNVTPIRPRILSCPRIGGNSNIYATTPQSLSYANEDTSLSQYLKTLF
jgi:hypothetical protein